jgi:hypothetical protein
MEIRVYKVYKFSELNDEQKEKVIENYCDINIDHDWWDSIYDDAKTIGLELAGFDIDMGSYCEGKFVATARECAEKILTEHGEKCETYKTAEAYLKERNDIEQHSTIDEWGGFDDKTEDELEILRYEFLKSLLEDYLAMLRHEFEYLTSKQAIIETIETNDYNFTEDGRID